MAFYYKNEQTLEKLYTNVQFSKQSAFSLLSVFNPNYSVLRLFVFV